MVFRHQSRNELHSSVFYLSQKMAETGGFSGMAQIVRRQGNTLVCGLPHMLAP